MMWKRGREQAVFEALLKVRGCTRNFSTALQSVFSTIPEAL